MGRKTSNKSTKIDLKIRSIFLLTKKFVWGILARNVMWVRQLLIVIREITTAYPTKKLRPEEDTCLIKKR